MSDEGRLHGQAFGKAPEALIHSKRLTDGAVRLYVHMHWRYGRNRDNHEGQNSMSAFLGVSQATISKRVNELEADDWVVTILRERNEITGNFTTPFYHVFERREDCIAFRKTYTPAEGEKVRPKPEGVRERKSRKGVGGNPKWKLGRDGQPNSDLAAAPNLSLDGGPNLSLDNLDSVDLDSIDLDSSAAPPFGVPSASGLPVSALPESSSLSELAPGEQSPPGSALPPLAAGAGEGDKSATVSGNKKSGKSKKAKDDQTPKAPTPMDWNVLERAVIIHLHKINNPAMMPASKASSIRGAVKEFRERFQAEFGCQHTTMLVRVIYRFAEAQYLKNPNYCPTQKGQLTTPLLVFLQDQERSAKIRQSLSTADLGEDTEIPARDYETVVIARGRGSRSVPTPSFNDDPTTRKPVGLKPETTR